MKWAAPYCLWEDEWATHLLQFDYTGPWLKYLQVWTSLVAQMVKRSPAMRVAWVQSLGREDDLEKEMAIHSSILAWKIPWIEEPVGYSPWGRKESDTTQQLN